MAAGTALPAYGGQRPVVPPRTLVNSRYGAAQATVMAAYLSEPITFSIASTGFIPTHCIT